VPSRLVMNGVLFSLMAIKVFSCFSQGLAAKLVEVEADIFPGMPAFSIVGLGDAAVQESRERIHSALKNSGLVYPQQKKIINLAPAHLKKNGPYFDLPMGIALLAASKQLPIPLQALIVGELALNGEVKPIKGALSIALFAKQQKWQKIFLPAQNAFEASLIEGIDIYGVRNIRELIAHLKGDTLIPVYKKSLHDFEDQEDARVDFAFIQGQEQAKRALEIAAASAHHLILCGSPGVGKTLLAEALPGILPPLAEKEYLEVMQIYSSAGFLSQKRLLSKAPPFRQVHHSASKIALIGGGSALYPGEISLAHHGVLFLDEIAEFSRSHLETLRQPLEERRIFLARSSGNIEYPADFTLIAAMNPCPCGHLGSTAEICHCTAAQISHYQKKLSGPLLDRIDLSVNLSRESIKIASVQPSKSSQEVRQKVLQARKIQKLRFKDEPIKLNSHMGPRQLLKYCNMSAEAQTLLLEASEKLFLSGRSYHKILKISRTIADLNEHDEIRVEDLSEALQYRQRGQHPI
jgi:magnesium chelatase family protein